MIWYGLYSVQEGMLHDHELMKGILTRDHHQTKDSYGIFPYMGARSYRFSSRSLYFSMADQGMESLSHQERQYALRLGSFHRNF